jgi:lipopolysaccharide transport system ATP-binding protein
MSFVLRATNLGKRFAVRESHAMGADGRGHILSSHLTERDFWAVRHLDFEIEPGEIVGLTGANGAGKTTLLRMIARTIAPSEGKIEIRGKVGAMLGADAAFSPDLTGRENCFLTGAVLGLKRHEVAERLNEILDFSGVQDFADTPVRYYSTGMYLRLAVSIALQLQTDLMLLDEALGGCDNDFRRKALSAISEMVKTGRSFLVVGHDLETQAIAHRAIAVSAVRR